jgi:hypothetical protein
MSAALQLLGALAVLAAFTAVQLGVTTPSSYPSLVLNLAGSAVLAVLALHEQLWGFLLLEAVWGLVSAWGLVSRTGGPSSRARSRSLRRRSP